MTVYCQNFKKHGPPEFKIFGITLPSYPVPVLCQEMNISDDSIGFYCPVCKEFVDVGPEIYASWGPLETRAGWPKSMIREM